MNKIFKKYTIMTLIYFLLVVIFYPKYYFLIWNVFIAYIPFLLSFGFGKLKYKILEYINMFIVLIFWPNAIYIFTDLIHISVMRFYKKTDTVTYIMNFNNWIRLSLIFIAVLVAVKLSYYTVHNYVKNKKNKKNKYTIYAVLSLISGLAVFVGRFGRLNSWYLFQNPIQITMTVLSYMKVENIKYMLFFALIQFIVLLIEEEY